MDEYQIASKVVIAAIEVHKYLGPNQYTSNYEVCMIFELQRMGLKIKKNVSYPYIYKGYSLDFGHQISVIVEDKVILDIISVENIYDIHKVKLKKYLELTGLKYALQINFNIACISKGIHRMIRKVD